MLWAVILVLSPISFNLILKLLFVTSSNILLISVILFDQKRYNIQNQYCFIKHFKLPKIVTYYFRDYFW